MLGALGAAMAMAVSLAVIDRPILARAFIWAAALDAVGFGHLVLCRFFWAAAPTRRTAPFWPRALLAFYLAEGLLWGWCATQLAGPDRVYDLFLIYTVVGVIAAGSATVLANYLPAFYVFFLPTLLPIALQGPFVDAAFSRIAAVYVLFLVVAMIFLARRTNAAFVRHLLLRIEAQDLTEELKLQRELAEQANLSKSRFLASASHDLRQPVHALGMFIGALKTRARDEETGRLVEHIEASVNALDDLFTSLLDISRLDAGVVSIEAKPFLIQRLLERILREHEADAARKGLRLTLMPSSAIVLSDPLLFERILRNIVTNALRYTDRGRVLIGCRRRGARLLVEVWDTGRGIPADRQAAIFEEFYQLGNPERDRTKGLGLGLAIVKRLALLLGCEITLRSQPGLGSVFAVAVPLADGARISAERVLPEPTGTRSAFIVVIDDEMLVREAMRSLLSGWGHIVSVAGSGDEMLATLAHCSARPDLIICDYRLRESETGLAVIERLHLEYNVEIPAILITGDTGPDRLGEARDSGLLLLHKPVPSAKLRAAIGNLLRSAPSTPAAGDLEATAPGSTTPSPAARSSADGYAAQDG